MPLTSAVFGVFIFIHGNLHDIYACSYVCDFCLLCFSYQAAIFDVQYIFVYIYNVIVNCKRLVEGCMRYLNVNHPKEHDYTWTSPYKLNEHDTSSIHGICV